MHVTHGPETLQLRIESLGNRVGGIARPEGASAVFVRGALPGEVVTCRITSSKKNFRTGELVSVDEPSQYRIKPSCPMYGICGGCSLQHLDYERQLHWKREWVRKALARVLPQCAETAQAIASPLETGYRNRVSFDIVEARLGLHRFRGDPVPVDDCELLGSPGRRLMGELRDMDLRGISRISVRCSFNTTDSFLEFRGGSPDAEVTCNWAELTPSGWRESSPGGQGLSEKLHGYTYPIPPGGFFQVNSLAAELLIDEVLSRCDLGNVMDLYGGVGTLGIPIAGSGRHVVSVELNEDLSRAGSRAAEFNGVKSISFVCGRDGNFLSEVLSSGESFRTIVVDPPRAGMGTRISRMLGRIGAHRIVYVSCNPFSLARDLACLITSGYIAAEIQPLDMFPQTDHIETLVLLERKGSQQ
jgi:23S rRNA (uracil1939-C5)-methyltransferase